MLATNQVTAPPFGGPERGCVDDELLCGCVESGSGLNAVHVRAVRQFCLSVAPDDLKTVGRLIKLLQLLFVPKVADGRQKHFKVQ